MDAVSTLLRQAVKSVVSVNEQSDIDSFFGGGEMTFLGDRISGLDDFELICFVAVRSGDDA